MAIAPKPHAITMFDQMIELFRVPQDREAAGLHLKGAPARVSQISMAYHRYSLELMSHELESVREAGWGCHQKELAAVPPMFDWLIYTSLLLREEVLRDPNSGELFLDYFPTVGRDPDLTVYTFLVFAPGIILHVRDENAVAWLTEYMMKSHAGFALRSTLSTLARCPRSDWYPDRTGRHSLECYVDEMIRFANRRQELKWPPELWPWILSALNDHPEHADLAERLARELPK